MVWLSMTCCCRAFNASAPMPRDSWLADVSMAVMASSLNVTDMV